MLDNSLELTLNLKQKHENLLSKRRESVRIRAIEDAYRAKNGQIYKVRTADGTVPEKFLFLGCHGNGGKAQSSVADLMEQLAADPATKPDFLVFGGDNFYDHGVSAPDDPIITHTHTQVYAGKKRPHLSPIPGFSFQGNHDQDISNFPSLCGPHGVKRGLLQVARSYLAEKINGVLFSAKQKRELYQNNFLYTDELPKWNMPARFYGLDLGNTVMFCLDSNTYVKDYLAYLAAKKAGTAIDSTNQAYWLEKEVLLAKQQGKRVILGCHHPVCTPGGRAFKSDRKLYLPKNKLSQAELAEFKKVFGDIDHCHEPYNLLFQKVLKHQHDILKNKDSQQPTLTFDSILSAHDHNMYYYNNTNAGGYPIRQIVAGGGGGHLQHLVNYSDNLGFFMRQHGVLLVETPANKHDPLRYHFHTTAQHDRKHHIVFTNDDKTPIRDFTPLNLPLAEEHAVKNLCQVVQSAIRHYLTFVGQHQHREQGRFFSRNLTHGARGVERANKLWAYINNHEADNLADTIKTVYDITKWKNIFTSPTQHSLITILNKEIAKHYAGKSIDDLYEQSHQLCTSMRHGVSSA